MAAGEYANSSQQWPTHVDDLKLAGTAQTMSINLSELQTVFGEMKVE